MSECRIDGCASPRYSRMLLCYRHYCAKRLTEGKVCSFPGCKRARLGDSWCVGHSSQHRSGGPMTAINRQPSPAPSWRAVHKRAVARWGSAKTHPCIHCGTPGYDWAYDGTDPDQHLQMEGYGKGRWYSQWEEFYYPCCRKCHGAKDGEQRARELFEYRQILYYNQELA